MAAHDQYNDLMETWRWNFRLIGKITLKAEPGMSGETVYPTSTRLSTNTGASGSTAMAENLNAGPKLSQMSDSWNRIDPLATAANPYRRIRSGGPADCIGYIFIDKIADRRRAGRRAGGR